MALLSLSGAAYAASDPAADPDCSFMVHDLLQVPFDKQPPLLQDPFDGVLVISARDSHGLHDLDLFKTDFKALMGDTADPVLQRKSLPVRFVVADLEPDDWIVPLRRVHAKQSGTDAGLAFDNE